MVRYHSIYLWGAQGQLVNQLTEEQIKEMETSNTNANRVITFVNMLKSFNMVKKFTRAFDCSGLICWALVMCRRENEGFDMTADNLFKRYPHVKTVSPGVLVHRSGHIGCYIGYNHVVEAKGRDWGVVITPFDQNEWDKEYANPWA